LGLSNTYDSNALYSDQGAESDDVFKVIPGTDVSVAWKRLSVFSGYRYTFRKNIRENVQSSNEQRAHFESNFRLSRTLLFTARDHIESASDPANIDLLERTNRFSNDAEAGFKYVTPGEDLELGIFYTHLYQKYDSTALTVGLLNHRVSITSRLNISSQFRFLPKSILFFNGDYGKTDIRDVTISGPPVGDSQGGSFSLGITSLLTRKVSFTFRGGTTLLFFDQGPDAKTIIGSVDTQYQPSSRTTFVLGYERSTQIRAFTNFEKSNRLRFDTQWQFGRKFKLVNNFRFSWLTFSDSTVTLGGLIRKDRVLQDVLSLGCDLNRWVNARLEYQIDRRASNAVTEVTHQVNDADFLKHQIGLVVEFYY